MSLTKCSQNAFDHGLWGSESESKILTPGLSDDKRLNVNELAKAHLIVQFVLLTKPHNLHSTANLISKLKYCLFDMLCKSFKTLSE